MPTHFILFIFQGNYGKSMSPSSNPYVNDPFDCYLMTRLLDQLVMHMQPHVHYPLCLIYSQYSCNLDALGLSFTPICDNPLDGYYLMVEHSTSAGDPLRQSQQGDSRGLPPSFTDLQLPEYPCIPEVRLDPWFTGVSALQAESFVLPVES